MAATTDLRDRIMAVLDGMDPWDSQEERAVLALRAVMELHTPFLNPRTLSGTGCRACMWRRTRVDCPTVRQIGRSLGLR